MGWRGWGRDGEECVREMQPGPREPSQQQQQNYVSPDPKETLDKGGSQQEAGRWP